MKILMNAVKGSFFLFIQLVTITTLFTPAFGSQAEITVGISHWPPMKTNTPSFGGIDVLILKEIEKEISTQIGFVACPWKRCIDMVKQGDVDMVTSFERKKKREEYVIFIEPSYTQIKNKLYKNKNTSVTVSKYEELNNYKIGTIKGGVYFSRFDNDDSLKRNKLAKEIHQLKMLASKRVDVIIGGEYNLDYLILNNNYQGIIEKLSFKVPPKQKAHLAMSKSSKHVSLIPKIEQVLSKMINQGEIDKIVANYFNSLRVK